MLWTGAPGERWSQFLRQRAKVDLTRYAKGVPTLQSGNAPNYRTFGSADNDTLAVGLVNHSRVEVTRS